MKRRKFLEQTLLASSVMSGLPAMATGAGHISADDPKSLYVIGPTEGYTPHIGVLVSMLNYNRSTVINLTKGMTMAELDHLHDARSNSIGSLLMHLGATDKVYQVNSFEGRADFNEEEKKIWGTAMELGEEARKTIRGHELNYYIDLITAVRAHTLAELKKRDDKWLLAVDPSFGDGKTTFNTYWKWFHVCEHESNHRGQIAWLKKRLPGAKETNE